jgi:glyoxylase-like metal-dependent hydrolase (beta-lactamase superfamily II)
MRKNLAAIAALVLCASPAMAQTDYSKVEEQVTDLGHNMVALTGAGGNTTVAVGTDGIIVVDTQFAPLYDKIKAKIAGLSPLPVKYVIFTHYHGDHTGGAEPFAKAGAILVSTPQLAARMKAPPPGANGQPGTPAPDDAIPKQTYSGESTEVKVAGATAELHHPAPAHTDGDTIVLWPAANVISTGDIVGSASYPNIDVAVGGGIDGMIAGATWVIDHADANTKIVPGHGPVTDKNGVIAYRTMLQTARDRIAQAKANGQTEDEVASSSVLSDLDAKWRAPGPTPPRFPRLVYQSIK